MTSYQNFVRYVVGDGMASLTIGRVMTFVIVAMSVLATLILLDGLAITSVFWVCLAFNLGC